MNRTILTLPENPFYWPSLSGHVKDYVLGGIYEPTLGYFSIDMREAFQRTDRVRKNLNDQSALPNNKAALIRPNPRLEGISKKVLLPLRNFLIKTLHYNWQVYTPELKLNQIKGTKNKIDRKTVVVLPNYQ